MLSDVDIRRYLGKEIGIFPFTSNSIQGSSIDLTASDIAWSLKTKKIVSNNKGEIIIPPHDTVIVITKESVYLSKWLAGYVISRVSTVSHGIGAISNPVKPNWIGRLFLSFHNVSDEPHKLFVGKKIAVLVLHELNNMAKDHNPKPNSRTDLIAELGFTYTQKIKEELEDDKCTVKEHLFRAMKESTEYNEYIKSYSRFPRRKKMLFVLLAVFVVLIVVILLFKLVTFKGNDSIESICDIASGAVFAGLISVLTSSIKNSGG